MKNWLRRAEGLEVFFPQRIARIISEKSSKSSNHPQRGLVVYITRPQAVDWKIWKIF